MIMLQLDYTANLISSLPQVCVPQLGYVWLIRFGFAAGRLLMSLGDDKTDQKCNEYLAGD